MSRPSRRPAAHPVASQLIASLPARAELHKRRKVVARCSGNRSVCQCSDWAAGRNTEGSRVYSRQRQDIFNLYKASIGLLALGPTQTLLSGYWLPLPRQISGQGVRLNDHYLNVEVRNKRSTASSHPYANFTAPSAYKSEMPFQTDRTFSQKSASKFFKRQSVNFFLCWAPQPGQLSILTGTSEVLLILFTQIIGYYT